MLDRQYKQQFSPARIMPNIKYMRPLIGISLITTMLLGIACSAHAAECAPPEAIEAYESGKAHLESGRLDKGISEIERAVAIYPDFGDAWYDLYGSYKRAGRPDDEIRALEQLIRINPGVHSGAEIWREVLALHRSEANIPSAAVDALNRCRSLKAGSKRAIAACERALSLHTGYVDAHYFLGVNYVYAGDEESAKEQLAALIVLDRTMAGMLANSMDVLTNWLTEDYKQELQAMFATTDATAEPDAAAEAPPAEFSDQDVTRILRAYEKQIEALQNLMADPRSIPKKCALSPPTEFRDQLKQQLMPLSFRYVEVQNAACRGATDWLFEAPNSGGRHRGLSEVVKIAPNLRIGDPGRERWHVGIYQEWVAEKYCKAECAAMLQFRIDKEIDGQPVKFNAWLGVVENIDDIVRCISSYYGEIPAAEEW
jgi:tetratricopeptide (TPR) repeat protein